MSLHNNCQPTGNKINGSDYRYMNPPKYLVTGSDATDSHPNLPYMENLSVEGDVLSEESAVPNRPHTETSQPRRWTLRQVAVRICSILISGMLVGSVISTGSTIWMILVACTISWDIAELLVLAHHSGIRGIHPVARIVVHSILLPSSVVVVFFGAARTVRGLIPGISCHGPGFKDYLMLTILNICWV
jgi:hypothetical protein